jgi:hypothetical protein
MEFKIQENIGAGVRKLLNGSRTFGSKELATDFEEADRPAKSSRQSSGSLEIIYIQCDD